MGGQFRVGDLIRRVLRRISLASEEDRVAGGDWLRLQWAGAEPDDDRGKNSNTWKAKAPSHSAAQPRSPLQLKMASSHNDLLRWHQRSGWTRSRPSQGMTMEQLV